MLISWLRTSGHPIHLLLLRQPADGDVSHRCILPRWISRSASTDRAASSPTCTSPGPPPPRGGSWCHASCSSRWVSSRSASSTPWSATWRSNANRERRSENAWQWPVAACRTDFRWSECSSTTRWESGRASHGEVVNSFYELEAEYVERMMGRRGRGTPHWTSVACTWHCRHRRS